MTTPMMPQRNPNSSSRPSLRIEVEPVPGPALLASEIAAEYDRYLEKRDAVRKLNGRRRRAVLLPSLS